MVGLSAVPRERESFSVSTSSVDTASKVECSFRMHIVNVSFTNGSIHRAVVLVFFGSGDRPKDVQLAIRQVGCAQSSLKAMKLTHVYWS